MPRILITGGSGRLGSAIIPVLQGMDGWTICKPTRRTVDVLDASALDWIEDIDPAIIIHCAAFANALKAESNRAECWRLNVEGTRNMVQAAAGRRFVFVSTDYVFDGVEGNYSESDPPNPINFYGVSKLAAEMIVSEHENTLILRAPFRADPPWRFARAFDDQWTSCRFASEVAPDVVAAALSDATGILHIGGPRRSIFDLANQASPGMMRCSREHFPGLRIPRDTSLDSSKWQALKASLHPAEAACSE